MARLKFIQIKFNGQYTNEPELTPLQQEYVVPADGKKLAEQGVQSTF